MASVIESLAVSSDTRRRYCSFVVSSTCVAGFTVQRLQYGPFLPFMDQLAPAKVTRILPEDRESRKGIVAFNQFVQTGNNCIITLFRQNTSQPLPFIRKSLPYQLLDA